MLHESFLGQFMQNTQKCVFKGLLLGNLSVTAETQNLLEICLTRCLQLRRTCYVTVTLTDPMGSVDFGHHHNRVFL